MDNIFVLYYVIERKLRRKERKAFALFIDLKTVFDKIDHDKL